MWTLRGLSAGLLGIALAQANATLGTQVSQPESWFHVSFAGTEAVFEHEGLGYLEKIAELSSSKAIAAEAIGKAADPMKALLTSQSGDGGASALERLVRDWVKAPSQLEVWRAKSGAPIWILAVHLSDERADQWDRTLRQVLEAGQVASALSVTDRGASGWEIKLEGGGKRVFRFMDTGGWCLLYQGPDQWPVYDRAVAQWSGTSAPKPAQTKRFLSGEMDLGLLAQAVDFPKWLRAPSAGWPEVRFGVTAKQGRLGTTIDLKFPESMGLEMSSWQIPTDTINDPLISFRAGRGFSQYLKGIPTVSELSLDPFPNQMFTWAQADTPFQSYAIFPSTNVTEVVKTLTKDVKRIARPYTEKRRLGNIAWRSERGEAQWRGLPFVVPFLRPVDEPAGQFVQIGMFPSVPDADPFPGGLLSEVQGREELVYYSWEITEKRLKHWRALMQLRDLILFDPQERIEQAKSSGKKEPAPPPRAPALKASGANQWIDAIASHLGNTVTEVRRVSPDQLRVVRNSHIGFTGLELVQLVRWLNPQFASSSESKGSESNGSGDRAEDEKTAKE